MRRVNYHLEGSQIERLQKRSEATGIPVAYMIRQAVEKYLETAGMGASKPAKRAKR